MFHNHQLTKAEVWVVRVRFKMVPSCGKPVCSAVSQIAWKMWQGSSARRIHPAPGIPNNAMTAGAVHTNATRRDSQINVERRSGSSKGGINSACAVEENASQNISQTLSKRSHRPATI